MKNVYKEKLKIKNNNTHLLTINVDTKRLLWGRWFNWIEHLHTTMNCVALMWKMM